MSLRAVERGDGALLGKRSRVAGAVALHGVDGLRDRLGRGEEADAPAGHRVGLGQAVHDDGVRQVFLREGRHAGERGPVVNEFLVNIVAHDEHALLDADIAQRPDLVCRVHGAGRVARRVEDEQFRFRRDRLSQLLRRDLELGLVGGVEDHRPGPGELGHLGVAQPVRRGDDHFVAGLTGGVDGVETGVLAAAVDDDLPRLVLDAVIALELVGDRLAKLRDAAARRVLGEAVGQRLRGSVLDVLRCVEVRLTGAEADDVLALGAQFLGLGRDGQRQRRRKRGRPTGDRIVH